MTNTNKILLTALLQVEKSLIKTEETVNSHKLPLSVHFNFSNVYDLFLVISSAFNIPETKSDCLYELLEKFNRNEISEIELINFIDSASLNNL